jgi:hypothetical protein
MSPSSKLTVGIKIILPQIGGFDEKRPRCKCADRWRSLRNRWGRSHYLLRGFGSGLAPWIWLLRTRLQTNLIPHVLGKRRICRITLVSFNFLYWTARIIRSSLATLWRHSWWAKGNCPIVDVFLWNLNSSLRQPKVFWHGDFYGNLGFRREITALFKVTTTSYEYNDWVFVSDCVSC